MGAEIRTLFAVGKGEVMEIRDKIVLVELGVSQWTARKYDRAASIETAKIYGADGSAGRYNKVLIAQAELAKIGKLVGSLRTYHYNVTLPYRNGQAILTTALLPEYMATVREYKGKIYQAVEEFVSNYSALKADAKVNLGGLYDEADYPSAVAVHRKFRVDVDFTPVPFGSDLRIAVSEEELHEMQQDIEDRVRESLKAATDEIWNRLYKVTAAMVERLTPDGEKNKIFRDSLVDNAREIAELLPKLNFTGDRRLEDLANEIAAELGRHDAQKLREDRAVRESVKAKAHGILAKIDRMRHENDPQDPEPEKTTHEDRQEDHQNETDNQGPAPETAEPEPVNVDADEARLAKLRAAGIL
jgi:hypothetical protein